MRVMAWLIFY